MNADSLCVPFLTLSYRSDNGDFLEEFWNAGGVGGGQNASDEGQRRRGWTDKEKRSLTPPGNASDANGGRSKVIENPNGSSVNTYFGPQQYKSLPIRDNLELYFRHQVFNDIMDTPYLEMVEDDRKECAAGPTRGEKFLALWKEEIIPCGLESRRKMGENKCPFRAFHGEIVKGAESSSRGATRCILCASDRAIYFIIDDEKLGGTFGGEMRRPACVARHSLESLVKCRIGFFFQRLVLGFEGSGGSSCFTYNVLTKSKMACYNMLKVLTPIANEAKAEVGKSCGGAGKVKIDNEDKGWLTAFQRLAKEVDNESVILYQILKQQWKSGGRLPVRRALVVTDTHIFLVDEAYQGDGSASEQRFSGGGEDGSVMLESVDVDVLKNVSEIRPADEDPKQITICFQQKHVMRRGHKWRLICRDGLTAEKIVEVVRDLVANKG